MGKAYYRETCRQTSLQIKIANQNKRRVGVGTGQEQTPKQSGETDRKSRNRKRRNSSSSSSILIIAITEKYCNFASFWFKLNLFIRRYHKLNKQVQETEKQYAYLGFTYR